MLLTVASLSSGRFSLCVEEGGALDGLHDDEVSWTVIWEAQLKEALISSLDASISRDDALERIGARARLPPEQPSTFHMLADWLFAKKTGLLPFDSSRATLCICDGDDIQLLREELILGHKYLHTLDGILRSLPEDYMRAAMSIARENNIPFARPVTPGEQSPHGGDGLDSKETVGEDKNAGTEPQGIEDIRRGKPMKEKGNK